MAEIEYFDVNTDGLYSDGDQVEQDIFSYVQNYRPEEYWKVLEHDQRWPVFYHLTDMRENVLNWYEFSPNCDVLEIGGGMGALTGLLCRRAGTVTSVELTRRRAEVIYQRCKDFNNLKILVGNFNDMEFDRKFDYITLIGVLEYAPGFTPGGDPADFPKRVRSLLKPGGKLLIAIENRVGMKYWCGANEDHTSKPFDGINGYPDTRSVRTYSRQELVDLLRRAGLERQQFYYPLPDYKLPQIMYSDAFLPDEGIPEKVHWYYLDNPKLVADEQTAFADAVRNGVFPYFANSFFVECCEQDGQMCNVTFAAFTSERAPEYQVVTTITSDGTVKKYAALPQAQGHLQRVYENQEYFTGKGLIPYRMVDGHLEMPFISAVTLEEKVCTCIRENDLDGLKQWITRLRASVEQSAEKSENGHTLRHGFLDLNFDNCFLLDDQLCFYDQEWMEQDVELSFILFRALLVLYWRHPKLEDVLPQTQLREMFGIDAAQAEVYLSRELSFQYRVSPPPMNPLAFLDRNSQRDRGNRVRGMLYFDTGKGYNEEESVDFFYHPAAPLHIRQELPKQVQRIRFDPVEDHCCAMRNLGVHSDDGAPAPKVLNGEQCGNWYLFLTTDPQFEISVSPSAQWIDIVADITVLWNEADLSVLQALSETHQELMATEAELRALRLSYEEVSNSKFWKMTKPARVTLDKAKALVKNKKGYVRLSWKGLGIFKKRGS